MPPTDNQFRVNTPGLNLRSVPEVRKGNEVVVLSFGHVVTKLAEAPDPEWWRVTATVNDGLVEGFVKKVRLTRIVAAPPSGAALGLPKANFPESAAITRSKHATQVRPAPLGEPGMPRRNAADAAGKVAELRKIISFLDAENSRRYQPTSSPKATFCNIYAYDYCHLAGAYLPRVWWTAESIKKLRAGKEVAVSLATAAEMTANMLFNWLSEFGPGFGWTKVESLDEVQDAANRGGVGIICAQRKVLSRSGHIVAVVPETPPFAARREGGRVVRAVESQAGESNHRFIVKQAAWWRGDQFRASGFWRHD